MRKFICLFIIPGLIACNDNEGSGFTVEGTIKDPDAKIIYLEENTSDGSRPVIADSAIIDKEGRFQLETTANEESLFSLRADQNMFPFAVVINDSRNINIHADPLNDLVKAEGSEATSQLIEFDKKINDRARMIFNLTREMDSLGKVRFSDTVTKKRMDSIANEKFASYESQVLDMKKYATDFIEKSESPVLSLYALGTYQIVSSRLGLLGFTQTEIADIINSTAKKFPDHSGVALQQKNLKPQAPDFSLPDTTGKMVSLSSFRGKYVLVDFWASWCRPCRLENPNIVAAYNAFKDKNFTILGVSLDRAREPWLEAIRKDSLTWTHISDLKYWNSAAAALYGVNSIPFNVLVDPQGNIIAERLHGQQLHATLREVLR